MVMGLNEIAQRMMLENSTIRSLLEANTLTIPSNASICALLGSEEQMSRYIQDSSFEYIRFLLK